MKRKLSCLFLLSFTIFYFLAAHLMKMKQKVIVKVRSDRVKRLTHLSNKDPIVVVKYIHAGQIVIQAIAERIVTTRE